MSVRIRPRAPTYRRPANSSDSSVLKAHSIPHSLRLALEACHRSDWPRAREICASILAVEPAHADAARLLEMIGMEEANPHIDRGVALAITGKHLEALASYDQAAALA